MEVYRQLARTSGLPLARDIERLTTTTTSKSREDAAPQHNNPDFATDNAVNGAILQLRQHVRRTATSSRTADDGFRFGVVSEQLRARWALLKTFKLLWRGTDDAIARCDKYLCPHTLSCVHFPHHCPCAFPDVEDKVEFGEGSMMCASKGGFKKGESMRKIELARKGLL